MTLQAKPHSSPEPPRESQAFSGKQMIEIADGTSVRAGYTDEADWAAERLQGATQSPQILFVDQDRPETVTLSEVHVSFVNSFRTEGHAEPIHFHENLPHSELLWVRLVLQSGAELEGMMVNSEEIMRQDVLSLTPTDPQTHARRILFSRYAVREFHVLGVRGG